MTIEPYLDEILKICSTIGVLTLWLCVSVQKAHLQMLKTKDTSFKPFWKELTEWILVIVIILFTVWSR